MEDLRLECEIKIRTLEKLKETFNREVDELISIARKVKQEHMEAKEMQEAMVLNRKEWLTIEEFAEKVDTSYTTIYERIRTGAIKAKRDNRLIRIPYSEYERYMKM
ncbi:MAG TPA: helix-turn-helix domain-containing protein [Candidatus Megamonas gallistercoris]|nr:helix-turn-helix domain-containing protein [Candidatus Megamonas gallistercoris]